MIAAPALRTLLLPIVVLALRPEVSGSASIPRTGPVILAANKCEGRAGQTGLAEAHALGLGPPIPFSAEHGEGLSDLHEAMARHIAPMPDEDESEETVDDEASLDAEAAAAAKRPMMLAIVGRPNVGKSTLLNRLVGEERVLTGPEAGITRDSVRVEWQWRGRKIRLIDTAGMRRRSRIDARLEAASVADTLDAIRLADVVVVVLDAADMLEKQDLVVAGRVIEEGRALVIAVNKTDLLADDRREATRQCRRLRPDVATGLLPARWGTGFQLGTKRFGPFGRGAPAAWKTPKISKATIHARLTTTPPSSSPCIPPMSRHQGAILSSSGSDCVIAVPSAAGI